jgi:alginate O-acetyltransferase complex protein AlgJ
LLEAKSRQQIWHEYNTHWTGLGAYIGYRALMMRMAIDMPEMQPLPLESFRASTLVPWQQPRDVSLMLGIGGFLRHGGVSFQESLYMILQRPSSSRNGKTGRYRKYC